MGSLSVIHWLIVLLVMGSPIMGAIRGVKNSSILHTVLVQIRWKVTGHRSQFLPHHLRRYRAKTKTSW